MLTKSRVIDNVWVFLCAFAGIGATAFAALLSGRYKAEPGERVGVIVCGGNTEPQMTRIKATD